MSLKKKLSQGNHIPNIGKAKRGIVRNIGFSYAVLATNALVNFFLTPYLIDHLGIAVYGMIALGNTSVIYLRMLPTSLANSLVRFLIVERCTNSDKANNCFTTCTIGLLVFSAVCLIPAIAFSWGVPYIFNVPTNVIMQTRWLFFFILLGGLVGVSASSFRSYFFIEHRMWEMNIIDMVGKIVAVAVLLLSFWLLKPSLIYVGIYQFIFLFFSAVFVLLIQHRRSHHFSMKRGKFSWIYLRMIGQYGIKLLMLDFSASLMLGGTVVIVNIVAGALLTGHISPFMQIMTLFQMLAFASVNVLRAIFFEYVGHGDDSLLAKRTIQATRIIAFIFGLSVVLAGGCAHTFLQLWLGNEFSPHAIVLLEMVMAIYLGDILALPYRQVLRGKDIQVFLILYTLTIGCIHLALIYLVLDYSVQKLETIGLISILTIGALRAIGQGLHCDVVLGWRLSQTFRRTHACYWLPIGAAFLLFRIVEGRPIVQILVLSTLAVICYFMFGYFTMLKLEDRLLLVSLIKKKDEA